MTPLDLELYEILADKTLKFGAIIINESGRFCNYISPDYDDGGVIGIHRLIDDGENYFKSTMKGYKILGSEPTLTDLHRFCMKGRKYTFMQTQCMFVFNNGWKGQKHITYNSSKSLMEQSVETKQEIVELISSLS